MTEQPVQDNRKEAWVYGRVAGWPLDFLGPGCVHREGKFHPQAGSEPQHQSGTPIGVPAAGEYNRIPNTHCASMLWPLWFRDGDPVAWGGHSLAIEASACVPRDNCCVSRQ